LSSKVVINIHGNLPEAGRPVVGNGIRAKQLGESLLENDFDVVYTAHDSFYADSSPPDTVKPFRNSNGFLQILQKEQPDILICIQGEGLDLIPESDFQIPVISDWIAPRMLEFTFQGLPLEQWMPSFLSRIRKSDYHLCCTEEQRAYLFCLLQMAGVDIRHCPTAVVPLSTSTDFPRRKKKKTDDLIFVAGGVSWPWIQSSRFLNLALEEMDNAGRGRLKIFGGQYPFVTDSRHFQSLEKNLRASPKLEILGMLPYPQLMGHYLEADVAVNLFEENPERRLALSFREIDYLKAGLPIVCASFSNISKYIRTTDAGWVLDSLEEKNVRQTFRRILALKKISSKHAAAARNIIREHFDQSKTILPVLEFLKNPVKMSHDVSLFQSALLWGEHARLELEKIQAENRALKERFDTLQQNIEKYRALESDKNQNLTAADATIKELRNYLRDKEKDLEEYEKLVHEKDGHLLKAASANDELKRYLDEKEGDLKKYAILLKEKDSHLTATDGTIKKLQTYLAQTKKDLTKLNKLADDKEKHLVEAEAIIKELRRYLGKKESDIKLYAGREQEFIIRLEEKDNHLKSAQSTMDELKRYLEEKESDLKNYAARSEEKDRYIKEKEKHLSETAQTMEELKKYIHEKEIDLEKCVGIISNKDDLLEEKEHEIHMRDILVQDLEKQNDALAMALHNIQSKLLYRIYKKIRGK